MLRVSEQHYSRERQPRHAHAETTVTLVLAGRLRERVGFAEEIAQPLSIVVKPRDTEHANDFGDAVRTMQIALSASEASALELGDSGFRDWRWHHGGPAVPAFLRLLRARRDASRGNASADLVEQAAYDALAALRLEPGGAPGGEPPRWLMLVREALDDSVRPPAVKQLAESAHVHPVYLARQFRRWFHCSITEHVARRRIQRAAAAIADSDRALALISYDTGFADQSHMCRAFARETGVTPNAYRGLAGV